MLIFLSVALGATSPDLFESYHSPMHLHNFSIFNGTSFRSNGSGTPAPKSQEPYSRSLYWQNLSLSNHTGFLTNGVKASSSSSSVNAGSINDAFVNKSSSDVFGSAKHILSDFIFRRPFIPEDPDLRDAFQFISDNHFAPCSFSTPLLVVADVFDWGLGNNLLCESILFLLIALVLGSYI